LAGQPKRRSLFIGKSQESLRVAIDLYTRKLSDHLHGLVASALDPYTDQFRQRITALTDDCARHAREALDAADAMQHGYAARMAKLSALIAEFSQVKDQLI
jgi:hypothetical protein